MRPFVWQVEKRPVLESDTDPNSRENILKRKFLYSVYGRYNVGVTDPRLGVKIENS
jgi:phage major head subunit gpT-like protein